MHHKLVLNQEILTNPELSHPCIPHCWKSHVVAQIISTFLNLC